MEINICIGTRLREERESLGMSQSDVAAVAEAAGVPGATRQSQAKYEKGISTPSAAYLAAIAARGIDVLYVLTGHRAAVPKAEATEIELTPREQALLDNYRHTHPNQKRFIEEAAFMASESRLAKSAA